MRKPHAIPVFVMISLIIGILLGFCFPLELSVLLWIFGGSLLFFLFLFIHTRFRLFQNSSFAISAFVLILSLGMLNVSVHQPDFRADHYLHQDFDQEVKMEVEVLEVLKSNAFYHNYIAKLHFINQQPAQGKILLSIAKDSVYELKEEERLLFYGNLESIIKALNPYQFDYSSYMANKHVFKQAKIHSAEVMIRSPEKEGLRGKAAKIRKQIHENLVDSGFSTAQIALMEAFILGQRKELTHETYTKFSEAGVVHILAVSGLHVGIILYFLNWILKPLTYLPKGKWMRSFIAVILLWFYAYLVGMTPSVMRAVTMFSFLSMGMVFKRRVFTLNMLCLSALVLLIVNPHNLFEVGFQLSYCAVLSILLFYHKLMILFPRKNKVLHKIGSLFSVTLAAQLGVLPLSLYYFHQFPGLFFVSNLLIVPALGGILGGGILIILFSFLFPIPGFIIKIYGIVLDSLQGLVNFIAEKDDFLFKNLYFSLNLLVISAVSIGLLAALLHLKNKIKYLAFFLISLIVFQLIFLMETKQIQQQRSFYVFHQSRYSALGYQENQQIFWMGNLPEHQTPSFAKPIQDAMGIRQISKLDAFHDFYDLGENQLLIIDSLGIWEIHNSLKFVDILLRDSPQINLERVLDSLQPKLVIADGSNYKSLINRWQQTCQEKNIPFHHTGEKGALQYNF